VEAILACALVKAERQLRILKERRRLRRLRRQIEPSRAHNSRKFSVCLSDNQPDQLAKERTEVLRYVDAVSQFENKPTETQRN
jgi:hypothetical protein